MSNAFQLEITDDNIGILTFDLPGEKVNKFSTPVIQEFEKATQCPVLINTSFNVRGEPIVCTPEQAFRCFMRTEMDTLVLENFVLDKKDQQPLEEDSNWQEEFELD